ncbi:MAG: hypothetical protein WCP29_07880 [Acidobacteriota bacterium]
MSDSRSPSRGVAASVGGLIKSAGRFSVAMGVFTARQAIRIASGSSSSATSALNQVSTAARTRLAGRSRTAYGVGHDIQHGLVDAACEMAGASHDGQVHDHSATGLSMSRRTCVTRRLHGVRTVASGTLKRPVPQAELLQRLAEYRADVMTGGSGSDRPRAVAGLWKSEGLATTIAKHLLPEHSWNDPALLPALLPVEHVGFGSGSTSFLHFDAARLHAVFAERCATHYRDFSYEGVGAILRAYESGFFRLMSMTAGLIRFDTPEGPNPAGFFADYLTQFSPEQQRLIAHGYGRLFAFSHMDVYDAIADATAFPPERVEPVVEGIAFAFLMINSADLPHILRHSAIPFERPVRAAFQNGLIYGMTFLEWYAPGFLAPWQPQTALEAEMVEHARRDIALSIARGYPLAARLAEPRH